MAEVAKSVGGELESFYFAFGDPDANVIADVLDKESAAAIALAVNAARSATVRMVALLTPEEIDAAANRSVDYRPRGARLGRTNTVSEEFRSLARERPPGRSAVGDGTFRTRLGGRRCQQRGQRAAVEIHLIPLDEVSIEDHKVEPGNLDRAALARRGQRP